MHIRFLDSLAAISAERWNTVAGTDYPFLRHEFLYALETSRSVGAHAGWQPHHLLVEDGDRLLAVLPLYVKSHSYGEYVFDWEWADAYERHGLDYYPKLLAAIPFTPATGPRLAHVAGVDPVRLRAVVQAALQEQARRLGASGWHCLFPAESEHRLWAQGEADHRLGCQYHWFNDGYGSFDDFLAAMTAKRRRTLRKEREKVAAQGIRLERLTGEAITLAHWQAFYRFYQMTYLKRSGHGGYLTPAFFAALHHTLRDPLLLVLAWRDDVPVAGSLSFVSSDTLYGRYWGATADIDCLHFEACYYQGIEFCIERGLKRFDPGAQGEHKIARGFRPVLTSSWHWLAHPGFRDAIRNFLVREGEAVRRYRDEAAQGLPFK